MVLRFSPEGPAFPDALVDDLGHGRVIFVCGAGVSAPQLPQFKGLVEKVREGCGMAWQGGERIAFDESRYEECLGALQRRLIRPEMIYELTAQALAIPAEPDYANHKTLLRLARDRENRVGLVTTNFDTMFERALHEAAPREDIVKISQAGQDLPVPGARSFGGIVHLHGRLRDDQLGLSASPLVLTSAEYGEAYMRAGWAARFLFDLARTATLVVVGYSAGDAPVRYFLNVLEADRDRFPGLGRVYALDGAEAGQEQQIRDRWDALAVPAITYLKQGQDHTVLWRDLARMADVVENTSGERRRRVDAVLSVPKADASPADLESIDWALRSASETHDLVSQAIVDPDWWPHLRNEGLLTQNEAAVLAGRWLQAHWKNRLVFQAFLRIGPTLGRVFGEQLEFWLQQAQLTEQPWELAWRLLAQQCRRGGEDRSDSTYSIMERMAAGLARDVDYRRLVRKGAPTVVLRPIFERKESTVAEARVSDLAWVDIQTTGETLATYYQTLRDNSGRTRIADLATQGLLDGLADGAEAGVIGPGWDLTDHQVPSIAPHAQNSLMHGFLVLTQLLALLVEPLVEENSLAAKRLFEQWRHAGYRLTTRLWLYALLTPAYGVDEAAEALIDLPVDEFWTIRRELVLVLQTKLAGCKPKLREALVRRTLDEAGSLFADLQIEEGKPDWRPSAQDQAVWLRLATLRQSGPIGAKGEGAFSEIRARRTYLNETPSEQDLFSIYSTSGFRELGNPEPILDTPVDQRLAVAVNHQRRGGFQEQFGWSGFVETSPQAALESLLSVDPLLEHAPMWGEFLNRISFGYENGGLNETTRTWLEQAFARLERVDAAFLARIDYPLTNALEAATKLEARLTEGWFERIWAAANDSANPPSAEPDGRFNVLNSSGGRLTGLLLTQMETAHPKPAPASQLDRARLERILKSPSPAGGAGRAALTRDVGFVYPRAPDLIEQHLRPRLEADTPEGRSLRALLVEWARLGPDASRALNAAIRLGVKESQASDMAAVNVAGKLLYPLLAERRAPGTVDYNLSPAEVAADLAAVEPAILNAVLNYLTRWLQEAMDDDPAREWRTVVAPTLLAVWPNDKTRRTEALTPLLLGLVTSVGEAFPEAWAWARPWIMPFTRDWFSLHEVKARAALFEQFPETVFDLLWAVCQPPFEGRSNDLAPILDALVAKEPGLATDRRMQWMEMRAYRPRGQTR